MLRTRSSQFSVFINNLEQAGANVITALEFCCGGRISEKALDILLVLCPLYTEQRFRSKSKAFCGPDPTQAPHPSAQGTTVRWKDSDKEAML